MDHVLMDNKARSIKKWISQFVVEEVDWPAQNTDLSLSQQLLYEINWITLSPNISCRPC